MKTVGILDALASPEVAHITWPGSTAITYIHFLQSAGALFDFAVYEVSSGQFPASVDTCDAYLITGSVNGAYEAEPWIAELIQFIRDCRQAGKKMVGICFGHQILAHALGGRSERSAKGWGLGLQPFELNADKPWMADAPGQCQLYFAHQDQVVDLPPGAERLGGSDFCENAFFALDDQIVGIQGHPEFSQAIMRDILAKPAETASPVLQRQARQSLGAGEPDNALFARWITAFLST